MNALGGQQARLPLIEDGSGRAAFHRVPSGPRSHGTEHPAGFATERPARAFAPGIRRSAPRPAPSIRTVAGRSQNGSSGRKHPGTADRMLVRLVLTGDAAAMALRGPVSILPRPVSRAVLHGRKTRDRVHAVVRQPCLAPQGAFARPLGPGKP